MTHDDAPALRPATDRPHYSVAYAAAIAAVISGFCAMWERPGTLASVVVVIGLSGASAIAGLLEGPAIADGRRSPTWPTGGAAVLLITTAAGAALGGLVALLLALLPAGPAGADLAGPVLLLGGGGAVCGPVVGIICVGLSLAGRTDAGRDHR